MTYRSSGAGSEQYPAIGVACYALFCLLLCYFMFFVDRNILTLLVAPVRRDLGISDSEMGVLNGFSFSILSGVMAIPFGWYADRRSRRNILIFGLALWGCSTIASGFTTTFTQLMLTRMGLGIGEAALSPAAFALISDYFPKARRGTAVGIYGIGGFGGIGLSYIIGGAVLASFRGVDSVNLPVIGETSLWHAAFIIVGLITLALALLMTTVREPARHATRAAASTGGTAFGRHFREHWGAFCVLIAAYTCLGFNSIGWFAWLPTYFIREVQMPPAVAGAQVGWVTTIGGVLGAVAGGYIADAMAKRGMRGGKLPTLALMFVMWIPCALGLWLFSNPVLSLACAFVFTFADGIGYMQAANVIQEAFPAHLRARSIAAWMVCSAVFSYGWGPIVFGYATDHFFGGGAGLRYSLGIVSLPVMLLGLVLAWSGRKAYDRTRAAADPTAQIDDAWLAGRPLAAIAQP